MKRQVLCISTGHLAGLDAGLGEFARSLGERVAGRSRALREQGVELCFHMQPALHGAFGSEVAYEAYRPRQRTLPWSLRDCTVWHSLFQHNISRPPVGVRHRLVTVHDLNFRFSSSLGSWRDSAFTRLALARSDDVATISRFVAQDVRRHLGWRGPLRTIYNGAADLRGARQEPLPDLEGRAFFFHLSRMAPSKNVGALVELARAWPEKRFVLAGPAWGDSRALADALGGALPNLTFLLGISEAQKAWLLAHCEAFLFPSLAEGFGLPPIEAMNFGTPVFLSDRTCLPEIGGDCAAYFSDFSAASMRAVIEQGLPPLRRRAAAIRRHARQFDWDRCAAGYLDWYSELLGVPLERVPAFDPER